MGSKERNIILTGDHSQPYNATVISGLLFHYILLLKKTFSMNATSRFFIF